MSETEFKRRKKSIEARYRKKRERIRKKISEADNPETDGFSAPSPLIEPEEALRDLEKEKIRKLKELEQNRQPHKFILDSDVGWREYEDFIAEHGTLAWHRKHGTLPSSYWSIFTEQSVCQSCGRHKRNCKCHVKQSEPFNFSYGKT